MIQLLLIYLIKMIQFEEITLGNIFCTIFIIFFAKLVFKNIVKPYRDYCYYKKILSQNYRTEVNPFSLLGMSNIKKKKEEISKYNDSHHYAKTQLTDYQVRLMKVGPQVLLDLIDPDLIKEYFQRQKQGCMVKRRNQQVFGDGLFMSQGNDWKKKKKILSHVFNFEFIQSKFKAIAEIVQSTMQKFQSKDQHKGKEAISIDIGSFFQTIFGNVVIKNFLGEVQLNQIDGQDVYKFISELMVTIFQQVNSPYAFIMRQLGIDYQKFGLRAIDKKINKMNASFNQFSRQIIQKIMNQVRQEKQAGRDIQADGKGLIWWVIYNDLLINDLQTKSNQKYNITELIEEMKSFYIAGTETTSNATTALIYTLAQKPEVLEKLKKELGEVLGSLPLTEMTNDDLKKLPYLDAVVKQALRISPPAATLWPRVALKDYFIGKIPIKKGMLCSVKIITNHYKSSNYENPLEFNPERWLKTDPTKTSSAYNFLPFSLGQRSCIGQHLSLIEEKLAVIAFVRKYGQIRLENPSYKRYESMAYGPERMTVFVRKN